MPCEHKTRVLLDFFLAHLYYVLYWAVYSSGIFSASHLGEISKRKRFEEAWPRFTRRVRIIRVVPCRKSKSITNHAVHKKHMTYIENGLVKVKGDCVGVIRFFSPVVHLYMYMCIVYTKWIVVCDLSTLYVHYSKVHSLYSLYRRSPPTSTINGLYARVIHAYYRILYANIRIAETAKHDFLSERFIFLCSLPRRTVLGYAVSSPAARFVF